MSDDAHVHRAAVRRREFLKLGALGAAASLSGCATGPGSDPERSALLDALQPLPPSGFPNDRDQRPAPPPVGDLIDPAQAGAENWQEPWVWRPAEWPDGQVVLNVTRHQNPGGSPNPGNPAPAIFAYNGGGLGPTIRVRGDGTAKIKVRNLLGLNDDRTQVGPSPDPFELPFEKRAELCRLDNPALTDRELLNNRICNPSILPELLLEVIDPEVRPGWAFKTHANGVHAAHTTNLHTHGLHVAPVRNPDGTHSDNVLLRIIPRADLEARRASGDPALYELGDNEHVGELDYEIQLAIPGRDGVGPTPHPPGTHWYHPHSHGATHNQVSSGMAGFFIVEGDVDEALNGALTGESWPDPSVKTGPWDYRERLIFIQRVQPGPLDPDAGRQQNDLRFPPLVAVNGIMPASVVRMRPGAVERWRVLNGSVDGSGTKRFMVVEGQYIQRAGRIWRVVSEGVGRNVTRRLEPTTEQDFEDAKVELHQLSFDGITLVADDGGTARHFIKDLSAQNAGTQNPLARTPLPGESEAEELLGAYEACYRDGDALRRAYVRPNEVYLGNANRADVFFKAPLDSEGKVYTIFAKEAHLQSDNYQSVLQTGFTNPAPLARRPRFDVVVAYIHVDGDAVEGGDFDIQSLTPLLPPVPRLFQPVREEELRVPAAEAQASGAPVGSARTRVISDSGTGGADFPTISAPDEFCDAHPELENLRWGTQDGHRVLLPNLNRTMAINVNFDLAADPRPGPPRKFMPNDPMRSRVLVDTAEEWALYNCSSPAWSHTDRERFPQPGSYFQHYHAHVMTRAEGQRRFREDPEFQITGKANDHPFHIHINPIWVLRIDVPDENGDLHNVLPEPRWMDTVSIPRNGGRVVFRSRFDDFVGTWVHHCHVLLHEDVGMMQVVECVDDSAAPNYRPRSRTASHDMTSAEVDRIYPRPSAELRYVQNMSFVDPNEIGREEYPGFPLELRVLVE